MSSPFQKAFSAKSPLKIDPFKKKKDKTFTMSELNEKSKKQDSLSKEQALKLPQREGLGNPDYEFPEDQRFAGDDGYEDAGPLKKNSPLNGSYASPAGEPYVSHVAGIQGAVAAVQGALNSYMNESDANKAKRLQSRVNKRNERFGTGDSKKIGADGSTQPTKEEFLKEKGIDSWDKASKNEKDEYNKKLSDWDSDAQWMMQDKDGKYTIEDPTIDKTMDLQKRATAHSDAAAATANSEKDAEIKKLQEQIELLKGK